MTKQMMLALEAEKTPAKAMGILEKWGDAKRYSQMRYVGGGLISVDTLEASFVEGAGSAALRAIEKSVLRDFIEEISASYVRIVIGLKSN